MGAGGGFLGVEFMWMGAEGGAAGGVVEEPEALGAEGGGALRVGGVGPGAASAAGGCGCG